MSLPHLLLVDDSEAVLAFETAALSSHYAISTATNGRDALLRLPLLQPAGVLLDLSMPEMDGDEVLVAMQRDPVLRRIPVIVVSSEHARAQGCLAKGAKAFLGKPIRAPDLLPLVARVLDQARAEARQGNLAVLFVTVGDLELGLPLDSVSGVLHQTATRPIPLGPPYLSQLFELQGEPICVLDLALRLSVPHKNAVVDRKLVVVAHSGQRLALCVDSVRDPEELPSGEVTRQELLGGGEHGLLRDALIGMARTPRGPVPLIDPRALVSPELLEELAGFLGKGAA